MDVMDVRTDPDYIKTANSKTDGPIIITVGDSNLHIHNYEELYELTYGDLHNKFIGRGTTLQKELWKHIKASGKHLEVYYNFKIPAPPTAGKKSHMIDILIEDESEVDAFDHKCGSFNHTQDAQKTFEEYQSYERFLEEQYPDKKVKYGILKEHWDTTKDTKYEYLNGKGMPIYDTYTFMKENYGIDVADTIRDINLAIFEKTREDLYIKTLLLNERMRETE